MFLSKSVINRLKYFMIICLFRKKSNPCMLEQILLNKTIKCADADCPHFENIFKTNQKYPIIYSFCEKVVAYFTIIRNLSITTDATVNNLRADLYLKCICILEKPFDFFTEHTRLIFLFRPENVKNDKYFLIFLFSVVLMTKPHR